MELYATVSKSDLNVCVSILMPRDSILSNGEGGGVTEKLPSPYPVFEHDKCHGFSLIV